MKVAVSALCCALSVCTCAAEDFSLNDGRVLYDATVLRQGMDELQIRHSGGIQRVSHDLLSPELQQRFEMTPEQVEQKREEARIEAEVRKQAKREAEEEHRARMETAGQHARYLQGADVLRLLRPKENVDFRMADYLACEWNRQEAERLGLQGESRKFAEEVAVLKVACADLLKKESLARRELEKERVQSTELRTKLAASQEVIARLQEKISSLRSENNALMKVATTRSTETIVVKPVPMPPPPRPIVLPPHPKK